MPLISPPPIIYHWEAPGFVFSHVPEAAAKVPCKLGPLQIHFSRLKKSQFSQPVLKGQTLNLVTVERQICLALEAQITPRALDTIQRVPTRAG